MKRILVVDDDTRLCDVLSELLTHDGYGVVIAHDGHAALERLRSEAIELLIVDINMPGLGGASLVHTLRTDAEWERVAGVPVIVLSALWDVVTFDLDVQAGFAKPMKYDQVQEKIRELIGPP